MSQRQHGDGHKVPPNDTPAPPEPVATSPVAPQPLVSQDGLLVLKCAKTKQGEILPFIKPHPAIWGGAHKRLLALNERITAAPIEGVPMPIFRRTFIHDMQLGGRFVTDGAEGLSMLPKAARSRITMAGEAVATVDIAAAHLTICLALIEQSKVVAGADLYAVGEWSRKVIKTFILQTLGSGGPKQGWAKGTPKDIKRRLFEPVRAAVLERYPCLVDVAAVLPRSLASRLPKGLWPWAAGMHLMWWESRVLEMAMERLAEVGVVALPLGDALVVPVSAAEEAKRALEEAFAGQLGVKPRIRSSNLQQISNKK